MQSALVFEEGLVDSAIQRTLVHYHFELLFVVDVGKQSQIQVVLPIWLLAQSVLLGVVLCAIVHFRGWIDGYNRRLIKFGKTRLNIFKSLLKLIWLNFKKITFDLLFLVKLADIWLLISNELFELFLSGFSLSSPIGIPINCHKLTNN